MKTIEYKALYFCVGLFLGAIIGVTYQNNLSTSRGEVLPLMDAPFNESLMP